MTPMSFRLVNIKSKQQKHKSPTYRTCQNALHLKKDMDLIVLYKHTLQLFFLESSIKFFKKCHSTNFFFFFFFFAVLCCHYGFINYFEILNFLSSNILPGGVSTVKHCLSRISTSRNIKLKKL